MSRILGPQGIAAYAELLRTAPTDPADGEFDGLASDAPDDVRQSLAERMAPQLRRIGVEHPHMGELYRDAPRGGAAAEQVAVAAVAELLDPAQLDVLRRMRELLASRTTGEDGP